MKEKQEITVMEGVKAILREPTLSFPINVLRELAQLSLRYSQLLLQSANTEKERKYLHEKIESLFSQVPTLKKIIFEKERVAVSFVLRKRKSWNLPILEQILKDNLSQYVTFSISVRAFGALSGNEKERILHELEQVLKTFRLNFEIEIQPEVDEEKIARAGISLPPEAVLNEETSISIRTTSF